MIKTSIVGAVLGAMLAIPSLYAVDGVVLIDQNRALAGNVTPGDTPGFPVTITQPGSYKLSGNLTVPNANTSGIVIAASHVTIDLGGFAIIGPVDCTGGSCIEGIGLPAGIQTSDSQFNLTIRNGSIQGIGADGIFLSGGGILIEQMHVRGNARHGIRVDASNGFTSVAPIIRNNTVELNEDGIATDYALIEGNTVQRNRGYGISTSYGRVLNNLSFTNARLGLSLGTGAGYTGNVMRNNTQGSVSGGINLGQNLCANALCAGAVY